MEDINTENKELQETLVDCRALMKQIIKITGGDSGVRLMANDFRTVMQDDEK